MWDVSCELWAVRCEVLDVRYEIITSIGCCTHFNFWYTIIDHKMSQSLLNCFRSPSELMWWTRESLPRCLALWAKETNLWQFLGSSTAVTLPRTWGLSRLRLVPEEVCWSSAEWPTNTEGTTPALLEITRPPSPGLWSSKLMVQPDTKYTQEGSLSFLSSFLVHWSISLVSYLSLTVDHEFSAKTFRPWTPGSLSYLCQIAIILQ